MPFWSLGGSGCVLPLRSVLVEVEVEVSVTILSLASWGTAARKSADRQRAPEHQLTTGLLEIDMGKADADMSSLNEYVFYNPCQFLNSYIRKYFFSLLSSPVVLKYNYFLTCRGRRRVFGRFGKTDLVHRKDESSSSSK